MPMHKSDMPSNRVFFYLPPRQVRESVGAELEDVFEAWDPEPVARCRPARPAPLAAPWRRVHSGCIPPPDVAHAYHRLFYSINGRRFTPGVTAVWRRRRPERAAARAWLTRVGQARADWAAGERSPAPVGQ